MRNLGRRAGSSLRAMRTLRRRIAGLGAVVVLVGAAPALAEARKPAGGGSTPKQPATLAAPYQAEYVPEPESLGLSADRTSGRLLADPFPDLTTACCRAREGTAYVGSNKPSGTWRTMTVTIHVTRAHTLATVQPFFEAYFVLGYGFEIRPENVLDKPYRWCTSEAIFRASDGTPLGATVENRDYVLTCPADSHASLWAGTYLRASALAPIELDATVKSIVLS